MKNKDYLIVHKSLLPEYLDQVIEARELINEKNYSITEACKIKNISRTVYYKYKDFVFKVEKNASNKIILNIKTQDEKGILSSILKIITESNGNVITINQDHPVDGSAYITIAIDITDLCILVEDLKDKINNIVGVKSTNLSMI